MHYSKGNHSKLPHICIVWFPHYGYTEWPLKIGGEVVQDKKMFGTFATQTQKQTILASLHNSHKQSGDTLGKQ